MWGLECLCTLGRFGSQLFRKETPMLTGKRPPKLPLIAAAALVAAAGVLCFPLLHANSLNARAPCRWSRQAVRSPICCHIRCSTPASPDFRLPPAGVAAAAVADSRVRPMLIAVRAACVLPESVAAPCPARAARGRCARMAVRRSRSGAASNPLCMWTPAKPGVHCLSSEHELLLRKSAVPSCVLTIL